MKSRFLAGERLFLFHILMICSWVFITCSTCFHQNEKTFGYQARATKFKKGGVSGMYKYVGDLRENARRKVDQQVDVNYGASNRGGLLRDISRRGASVLYLDGEEPVDDVLSMGDLVHLKFGTATLPSKIVRMFENGFAVEFDWSAGMNAPETRKSV